jgi:hypothetical protein
VGVHKAIVAAMVFVLSQRILPGQPYVREGDVRAPQPPHAPGVGVPHAGHLVGQTCYPARAQGSPGSGASKNVCGACPFPHRNAQTCVDVDARFFGTGLQRSWPGARAGGKGLRI